MQNHFAHLKDASIMMVDDEPIMMEIIQTFLEDAGYRNFLLQEHSAKALVQLRQLHPDVLLLDLMMPEVDGFQILSDMRHDPELKYIPVIVLTSSSDSQTKLKALEMGATDFLAKPVDPSELVLRLRNTLTVKAYQDQLAYYDSLTGLPNRKLFLDRLDWGLRNARREQSKLALLHIGIDRFKQINDAFGPRAGDELLKRVAERLIGEVRQNDSVGQLGGNPALRNLSRLGGDEFTVLMTGIDDAESAGLVARRLVNLFDARPFQIDGSEVFISVSVGVALAPDDGSEVDTLLKNAAVATEHAKQAGRDGYQYYSRKLNERSREHLDLESDLRHALQERQLELHYQPKIDPNNGGVYGMEALVRWHHPSRGMLPPGQFIGLAERTGLILPMGDWVLQEACRQTRAWQEQGLEGLKVSVNVSSHQFQEPGFCDRVASILSETGLPAASLMLELTESLVMESAAENIRTLNCIREIGASLSVDDFGTGYSSLNYLKRFPIDELKIDRSFVIEIARHADDRAIVSAIIAMAHGLDLMVVAEGVEMPEQLEYLRERDCDLIQGFYYSKPLPAEEFASFVRNSPSASDRG